MAKGNGQHKALVLTTLKAGEWVNDAATNGASELQARKLALGPLACTTGASARPKANTPVAGEHNESVRRTKGSRPRMQQHSEDLKNSPYHEKDSAGD